MKRKWQSTKSSLGCVEKGIKESDAQTLWQTFEYFQDTVLISPTLYLTAFLVTSVPISSYYPVEWLGISRQGTRRTKRTGNQHRPKLRLQGKTTRYQ